MVGPMERGDCGEGRRTVEGKRSGGIRAGLSLLLASALAMLMGCGGASSTDPAVPLSAANVNLVFVVSPDLAYQGGGDVNTSTANLTSQGLQRSLLLATYLKQQVLGGSNVSAIYGLQPMSHLQTPFGYPDMAALEYIQQFALLNRISLTGYAGPGSPSYTGNSYPLNASYGSSGPLPAGVATPLYSCPECQGLDFNDAGGNLAVATAVIGAGVPGFYVFCAPWETISALMADIRRTRGYELSLPASYEGPNHVYAVSITPSGGVSLTTYNAGLNPPATYPVLPSPVRSAACNTQQSFFSIGRSNGVNGAVTPANINKNETVYLVRHAEAHPLSGWDDGNFLAAGQWRALALPGTLRGVISPAIVYSIDPAQVYPGAAITPGNFSFSYVRPSLTVAPYAIANNLPYFLVSGLELFDPDSPRATSDFFFTGGRFSNQTILLAWEHAHFPPTVSALLASYGGTGQTAPDWPSSDYDTIWRVTLDADGNVTVDNALCEGIDSAALPATAPQFPAF